MKNRWQSLFPSAWLFLSIPTFYLAALNTLLSRFAGTCTQGDADRLLGVFTSAFLYVIAITAMKMSKQERWVVIFTLPIAPVLIWQVLFSLKLSYGILVTGHSVCDVLEGYPFLFRLSGREFFYALAWPLMSFATLGGYCLVWSTRTKRS